VADCASSRVLTPRLEQLVKQHDHLAAELLGELTGIDIAEPVEPLDLPRGSRKAASYVPLGSSE
jgi:hypothetical protein